jgi:hypothetical protein
MCARVGPRGVVLAPVLVAWMTIPAVGALGIRAPVDRTLKGRTAQGLRVSVVSTHSHRWAVRFVVKLACPVGGSQIFGPVTYDVRTNRRGGFNASFLAGNQPSISANVHGQIRGRHASGVLSVAQTWQDTQSGGPPSECASGPVTWKAAGHWRH